MLEWQTNDKGQNIPTFNGKPLCSKVSPDREAASWTDRVLERLYADTDSIIVLGYGGGYHVKDLLKKTNVKVYVFEKLSELSCNGKSALPELQIITFDSVSSVWSQPKLKEILLSKFQIFQHYPSTSPFIKDYDLLRHTLTARNQSAFKKQLDLYIQHPILSNVSFAEDEALLSAKALADHPTVHGVSSQKSYIWKVLGELLK